MRFLSFHWFCLSVGIKTLCSMFLVNIPAQSAGGAPCPKQIMFLFGKKASEPQTVQIRSRKQCTRKDLLDMFRNSLRVVLSLTWRPDRCSRCSSCWSRSHSCLHSVSPADIGGKRRRWWPSAPRAGLQSSCVGYSCTA